MTSLATEPPTKMAGAASTAFCRRQPARRCNVSRRAAPTWATSRPSARPRCASPSSYPTRTPSQPPLRAARPPGSRSAELGNVRRCRKERPTGLCGGPPGQTAGRTGSQTRWGEAQQCWARAGSAGGCRSAPPGGSPQPAPAAADDGQESAPALAKAERGTHADFWRFLPRQVPPFPPGTSCGHSGAVCADSTRPN